MSDTRWETKCRRNMLSGTEIGEQAREVEAMDSQMNSQIDSQKNSQNKTPRKNAAKSSTNNAR